MVDFHSLVSLLLGDIDIAQPKELRAKKPSPRLNKTSNASSRWKLRHAPNTV